ncbi:MAG: hypothetical protein QOK49_4815, partial [Baekduia sp.]|nr:hypothetical protein [Baekduia sp.]
LLMSASALGDRFGRRRLFAAGLLLFALASAACGLATSAGAAFVMPLGLALVGAAFPPERRGSAMGALQGLTGLAVASGPVVGGAVAHRGFSAANGATFLTVASLFAAVFFLAQFLQSGLGYGPLGAGLRLLPWTATLFFVAPVAGALIDRIGERPLLVAGLTLQGAGMAWIALIADPGMAYGRLVPALMVAGCGVSMAIVAAQSAGVGAVAPETIGKAAGINSTLRELGGVFGIAVAVAVFAGAGGYATAQTFSDGFGPAIGASAALALAGAVVGLAVPPRRRAPGVGVGVGSYELPSSGSRQPIGAASAATASGPHEPLG